MSEKAHTQAAEEAESGRLYIVEHARFPSGDVSGSLLTEDGEVLHTHMSSSESWLRVDLTKNFGREADLAHRFGDFEVVYVALSDTLPVEIAHYFNSPDEEARDAE